MPDASDIGTMNTSQTVCYVILGKHDLRDPRKVLRLLISDPENLWAVKPDEGNIGRIFRKLLFADHIVQVITFPPRFVHHFQKRQGGSPDRFIRITEARASAHQS